MDGRNAESLLAVAEETRSRLRTAQDASAIEVFEGRYPDMVAAMDWFVDASRTDEAYRLASALVPFWIATKRIDDGDEWFERALEAPGGSDSHRARAVYDHGYLVFWTGRYDLALDRFTEAMARAEALDDHELEALALAGAARVALNTDVHEAVRLLRCAVDVTADLPDSPGRSSAMHVLGVALQMAGDLDGARAIMTERMETGRAHGNLAVVFSEAANLSMVERQLGNLDHAEGLSLEALRIAVDRHDEMAIPWVVNGLAAVTAAKGEHERAATLVGIAEGLLEQAGGEWPPDERAQFEGTLETLATSGDADLVERHRAVGCGMGLEVAVEYSFGEESSPA